MSFYVLLFLLALLNLQCTCRPVSSSDQNPATALVGISDLMIAPRQLHNESRPTPFIYPLPSNPSLVLRFSGRPGANLYHRDTLHVLTSIRLTLTKLMTTTEGRNEPIPFRTSRSNRYVHADIGRYDSDPSDGPRDGKSQAEEKVLTLEEGVQVVGGMYEMMKEHGFRARWTEVVEKADPDGAGEGVVVGFVRVTQVLVGAPSP